jgi:hypothetical protein
MKLRLRRLLKRRRRGLAQHRERRRISDCEFLNSRRALRPRPALHRRKLGSRRVARRRVKERVQEARERGVAFACARRENSFARRRERNAPLVPGRGDGVWFRRCNRRQCH